MTRMGGGGAQRQTLLLARELRATHDVQFFVMRPGGLFAGVPSELGIETRQLGWFAGSWREGPVRYPLGVVRALIAYIRLARHVDLVDAWLPAAYTLAGLAHPLVRGPALIAGRRELSDRRALHLGRLRRIAVRLAMRQVAAVVTNSEAGARDAIAVEGLTRPRVRVIRNGIDIPAPPPAAYRVDLRRSLGIREGELVVGCVAAYRAGKGLEAIISIANRLRADPARLRFVIVGDGPLRAALEQLIEALGIGDRVMLHGPHPDAQRLYPAFDIVVQASDSEGLPNSILEAAAWGRPIVATDAGGTGEIVRDRREALLVPPGDAETLAEALLELARDPALGQRLGAAARERAADFTAERLASETARLYSDVLSSRRRRVSRWRSGARDTRQPSA